MLTIPPYPPHPSSSQPSTNHPRVPLCPPSNLSSKHYEGSSNRYNAAPTTICRKLTPAVLLLTAILLPCHRVTPRLTRPSGAKTWLRISTPTEAPAVPLPMRIRSCLEGLAGHNIPISICSLSVLSGMRMSFFGVYSSVWCSCL